MRAGLYFDGPIPVRKYGGTERVIVWLAKGLRQLGHEPVLLAREGTSLAGFDVHGLTVGTIRSMAREPDFNLDSSLPGDLDVVHFHSPVAGRTAIPHLTTIHGNGEPGSFDASHVFVSHDHMRRMQGRHFVYNGIDPSDYSFLDSKHSYLLFLGLASRRVKGVDRAIRIARLADQPLRVAGGWRPSLDRRIRWMGMVDNRAKRDLLARARALLNPIRWEEPFGLVVVEALVSGTPVLATPRGAMSELVSEEVGALCSSDEEFIDALSRVDSWKPDACRQRVLDHFTHTVMAESYLKLYRRAIAGELADVEATPESGSEL
ncbi:MAG: glycosyltransferase [marine benthic group bacterium]|jgi:glycosyltransferase involved in cell wall biosynthesis|nr:glycosyltransferase [Gemmatimonadota bacterium]MCL7964308.1 glycosyltransferase [Gemmatimonadota bacterium]MCL7968072.1 glycosyltransferase [Gemmatimonadota bacterium]MCL7975703.1 glycosyltransferase [Gemmatimonadota bacterium]MCL7980846.1 glycosyltransferase [Gemmatimonadota bacterium]